LPELLTVVILSAVVPTLIAQRLFKPQSVDPEQTRLSARRK
jgi:regulator of extracellular matrix RemA (YlzA/DUF370 family)